MSKSRNLIGRCFMLAAVVVAGFTCGGCAAPTDAAPATDHNVDAESVAAIESALTTLDPRRSVVVTDVAILNRFSLREVLQRLLTNAGSSQTPAQLLLDWATARRTACGTFNGFPEPCADSGSDIDEERAVADPSLGYYTPIALTNRFDLASASGADCGEYRVAFNAPSVSGPNANFLIFEARLPNPSPQLGREGCRPVARFWANLSAQADANLRADALHDFYFAGLPGFTPVVDVSHYAGADHASGQIRLNARLTRTSWTFMEFRSDVSCGTTCSLHLLKSTTKSVPFPALAADVAAQPLASAFQNALLGSLTPGSGLLANRLSDLSSNLSDSFNIGRIDSNQFNPVPGVIQAASPQFTSDIQRRLSALGSTLTPNQLLGRVHSLTCGGCHNFQSTSQEELGGGLSLASNALNTNPEMLSTSQEAGPDGQRFVVKPVLGTLFMPERLASLTEFVNSRSIAGNLEAEANDGQTGVQLEACADTGGGQNAGFISDGSSLQWSVNVPTAGTYALTTRSATWAAASLRVLIDGSVVSPLNMPQTWTGSGSQYQTWQSFTTPVFPLSAGVHTLKVQFTSGNQNLNWVKLSASDACVSCGGGRNIADNLEAENNDGQAGVKWEACSDVGGGQNAAFISNGSFIQWTVDVPSSGSYAVTTRSATWAAASLQVLIDGVAASSLNLPSTWNGSGAQYQTWSNFSTGAFNLAAGTHTLKVLFTSGSQNLNYVRLQPQAANDLVQNGTFSAGGASWFANLNGASVSYAAGLGDFTINSVSSNSWDVQLTQGLPLTGGVVYTLCYDVKSNEGARTIRVGTDGDADSSYASRGLDVAGVSVTTTWSARSHTFTANLGDGTSRIAFDLGQSANNVQIDNVKLFAGTACP